MRTAHALAGREPQDFDYVEAHATGTVVGDRIEGNAIADAFGVCDRDEPLAAVQRQKQSWDTWRRRRFTAALLKTVLMMQERTFAPISRRISPYPTSKSTLNGATCRC